MYGGTRSTGPPLDAADGLSPRVRGNPAIFRYSLMSTRSIPACTGEPASGRSAHLGNGVYPRVYGGTPREVRMIPFSVGLSPRVRGNLLGPNRQPKHHRSIPACTGEPSSRPFHLCSCWVYPRVYGGTEPPTGTMRFEIGLSPRVRGNLFNTTVPPYVTRSIPACTGEPRRVL